MMASHRLKTLLFVTLGAMITIAGCTGGSSGSDSDTPLVGLVSLAVSDAPIQDARQVCIEFTEAEFKMAGAGNQVIVFDPPAKIDLLDYQGMNAAPLLINETLEAGEYQCGCGLPQTPHKAVTAGLGPV